MCGPASATVNRARTVAGSPSAGSLTSCVLDDAPFALDVERHGRVAIPGLREHDVDDQRGALERRARRGDAAHLNVALDRLAPDADGEHGNGLRR